MKNQKLHWFTTLMMSMVVAIGFAQEKISGTVSDGKLSLPGATVTVKGTTTATSTDSSGNFSLLPLQNKGELTIGFVGYQTKTIAFDLTNGDVDLGLITLISSSTELDEVVITIGSGVIDLAKDRKTPIAVSTIGKTEIQNKSGNSEFPEVMKNTPSVYVASQAGGYGDSKMFTRGFDQTNTAFLLNGQPINGMEDGNMYWSNWQGMTDVANTVQVQRGLGSSKLAISSVGGTINIITKATDLEEGGFAQALIGNDNYQKHTVAYSTGISEKGWGASFMFTNWAGDGYNKGTYGAGQNYFVSVGYKLNEKHNFNFLVFGAPQWHDQNFTKSIETYLENGRKYNNNYGYLDGKYMSERRNYYHKPVANLNWDFDIDEKSSLSTVLYASWGRGGGTGNWGNGRKRTTSGHVDFDAIRDHNVSVDNRIGTFGNGAYAIRASVNDHAWYGLVSNYNRELSENLSLNVGMDLRTYKGTHYRRLVDFIGLEGWEITNHAQYPAGYVVTDHFSANPWSAVFDKADNDQKVDYDYDEKINYGGIFGQIEYATDRFSAFFQGALSSQSHIRWDRFQYSKAEEESEKVNNAGYNIKAGASYTIAEGHTVFANAGHYSRQPYHDNIYLNFDNDVNPLTENEKITGLELGYIFTNEFIDVNLNYYRTSWKDRVTTTSNVVNDELLYTSNSGVSQLHSGIELDLRARPTSNLTIKGFASFGNWEYDDNAYKKVFDESLELISEETTDIKGGKVGNAAQTTFGLGIAYKITQRLTFDADYRNYSKLYAGVVTKENLELPSFDLVDTGLNYRINFEKTSLNFRLNVNNVFDNIYISESSSAIMPEAGVATYEGISVKNNVFFGNGRTWNFAMRFNF
ncbi:MAG: TonB-dependent receptor [Flavobacteriaceae bacterium]